MKCIQVLPILKHTFSEELTYWTLHDFSVGDLITVTLNKRQIYAIVSSLYTLSEAKEFIKSRDFAIKKIETYTKVEYFSTAFIKACLYTSKYFVRSFGEILSEYIPKCIIQDLSKLPSPDRVLFDEHSGSVTYIQKEFFDQIQYIEELTKTHSHITIIVPTDAYKNHMLHSLDSCERITILTPIDLYRLDVERVDVCILAYAGSEYYRHMRKGFDTRGTVREYCKQRHMPLIEMDVLLPMYTHIDPKDVDEQIAKKPLIHIVDQTESKTAKVAKKVHDTKPRPQDEFDVRMIMEHQLDVVTHKKLKLISPELFSLIKHAEKKKEDVFIYTTRKGLSTSVVCSDCGHTLTCEICKKPFSLKELKGVRSFVCPEAHTPPPLDTSCPICGNAHLTPLGSGTDALYEELQGTIDMPIIIIDGDKMTQAGVRNIFKKRKDKNHVPTIYIGTELALHQGIEEQFAYSGIASLETLLALPSRLAEFESARVVEAMRSKTTDTLVIQTRHPENIVWKCLTQKSWVELKLQMKQDAKTLCLPPFSSHVQIHIPHTYNSSVKDTQIITSYIQMYTKVDKMDQTLHIYSKEWPIDPLYKYLKSLPKYVRVEVDSPSLL